MFKELFIFFSEDEILVVGEGCFTRFFEVESH